MKNYILLLLVFITSAIRVGQAADKWNTSKSTHFIVYYKNAPEDFIQELVNRSEDYYNKIADRLGFRRFDFWLWDNRAKIYIYDDVKDYQVATGQPSWSAGSAIPKEKIIYAFPYAQGFFDTILPHEMGHIVFREFVGFDNYAIPIWLDEGVASYQQNSKYSTWKTRVQAAIAKGALIPLQGLSGINPQSINSPAAQLFYAEAVSIVDYLIKEFGKDNFVVFCQNARDKRDLQKALSSVYPFSNTAELDDAWQRYLKK